LYYLFIFIKTGGLNSVVGVSNSNLLSLLLLQLCHPQLKRPNPQFIQHVYCVRLKLFVFLF